MTLYHWLGSLVDIFFFFCNSTFSYLISVFHFFSFNSTYSYLISLFLFFFFVLILLILIWFLFFYFFRSIPKLPLSLGHRPYPPMLLRQEGGGLYPLTPPRPFLQLRASAARELRSCHYAPCVLVTRDYKYVLYRKQKPWFTLCTVYYA